MPSPVTTHEDRLQVAILNALFDAPAPVTVTALADALRATRRDIFHAVRAQALAGNIKRGEPLQLTAPATMAIAAGRMAGQDWRALAA